MPNSQDHAFARIRHHMAVLVDFSRLSNAATDMQRLLEVACIQVARATGVAHSKVLRYRSASADLLTVAGTGWRPGVVGHSLFNSDMASVAGRAYQTRLGILIKDLPVNTEFRYDEVLKEHGIVSLINSPINIDGVVWGVLELDSTSPNAFGENDEQFLTAYAQILGSTLRHHLLIEEKDGAEKAAHQHLAEAHTLLAEQNHRVRNYFQTILSVLGSRSSRTSDEAMRVEYSEIMNRISAIGLAHDLLTSRPRQLEPDAGQYLEALCSSIEKLYDAQLKIVRSFESILIQQERIVPLGLILNELLTNCFKYVVHEEPVVEIGLTLLPATSEVRLSVKDNGPGIQDQRDGSQGLRLVHVLTRQLSGTLEVESSNLGMTVNLTFPLI